MEEDGNDNVDDDDQTICPHNPEDHMSKSTVLKTPNETVSLNIPPRILV
jgi:hypothetical protein